ncbi:hypothetical protein BU24DRAFT_414117 [Aaosphaeria arxii CBS 175.79]|uniref:Nephrocystin 3-like N-terminal domain-containing protein n=1 Tax=Aaosphaeria arxii CBS 175.79 TaxID=1450172 RepID=A0A6A5XC25_9PLEO|nr:uncharacterized protein BU24DRAFT_414117 [Aaosphaeria arxii CBS 175.79]KAF2010542.1 hypothetical protein BU24DRAFT_414117 [Aaosphaeria arxii CBS 175.79]
MDVMEGLQNANVQCYKMDPIKITTSITAILADTQTVLGYLKDAKDAPEERKRYTAEIINLRTLLFDIEDHVKWADITQLGYTAVQALTVKDGPLDQFKQALEMMQGDRQGREGDTLVWKFEKEDIASIFNRMERLKSLLQLALPEANFKLLKSITSDIESVRDNMRDIRDNMRDIRDNMRDIRDNMRDIRANLEKVLQYQEDYKHRRLVEWISPSKYPSQHWDIMKRRVEGTGQWFLDAPETAKWLTEVNGTLFCTGMPGAGKTMIAAIVIDHLQRSTRHNLDGLAYVFCNYKLRKEQDAQSMLAAILQQLVRARPSAAEPAEQLHKRCTLRGTPPLLDEIYSALQVIDALDECRENVRDTRAFLAKLQALQAGRDLRLMVTSRFIPWIEKLFGEATKLVIRANEEDVKRLVADRLPDCIERNKRSEELKVMAQAKIVEAADGMFLLARLHADSLSEMISELEFVEYLEEIYNDSTAIDAAYKDTMARIGGN